MVCKLENVDDLDDQASKLLWKNSKITLKGKIKPTLPAI